MGIKPTKMQQAAIDSQSNVVVAAAAGSGKTAVLTERVIRMLKDKNNPISADRLLIVTFTNAAARQMRSRIEKRLFDEIAENPQDTALLKQKHLLVNADICTIDSFCIKLVRENFEFLGIKPDFKVSEGSGLYAVRQRVMSEVLGAYFMAGNPDFEKLLELTGCEYDEKNLSEVIERLYYYSYQLPFPEAFLDDLVLCYDAPFERGNAWYDASFIRAEEMLNSAKQKVQNMLVLSDKVYNNPHKFRAYATETQAVIATLLSVCESKDWDELYQLLQTTKLKNVPSGEKEDPFAADFKRYKSDVSDIIKEMSELFSASKDEISLQTEKIKGATKLLIELTKKYSQMLFEAYNNENEFTFSDIEQLALKLLCNFEDGKIKLNQKAHSIAAQYDEVLVDEYQDVNDLQDMLFQILSNDSERLFVVGDVKQCIYGFRGSNPANFLNRKDSAKDGTEISSKVSRKIVLAENFRSCKGVCDSVNFFFSLFFTKDFGGMEYGDDEKLVFSSGIPVSEQPEVAVRIVDAQNCDSSDDTLLHEAYAIADYIEEVMSSGQVIRGENGMRNAQYGDFAILLDKVKDRAEIIADGLKQKGIPVDYSGGEFLETVEISTILSFLKVIDNPLNDVELLCVMLSPIFNFTAQQVADIRLGSPRTNLFSAVKCAADLGDRKADAFCKALNELRLQAAVCSVDVLLSELFSFEDCFNKLCGMSNPTLRKANLLTLSNIAKDYCQGSRGDVYGFIKFINSLPSNSFKPQTASSGGVKIMTIHNSKGLQFPVCILANCETRINNADSISAVLFDQDLGVGFRYYSEEQDDITKTLSHKIIAYKAADQTREEKMRLLYVALTRAVDRLCIFTAYKNVEGKLSNIAAELSYEQPHIPISVLKGASAMADWILAALAVHPDGAQMLKKYDIKAPVVETDSEMDIRVVNPNMPYVANGQETEKIQPDLKLADEIVSNTQFYYPYDELKSIRQKASVSLLANSQESADFAFSALPDFMAKDGLSAAGRGTAMHKIMQFIDFSASSVAEEIERLVEYQFITETEAKVADIKAIERFFESELFLRLSKAQEINREMRFVAEFSVNDVYPDIELEGLEDETVMLQGAIDLCFIEDGKVIIVDFKTDRVDSMPKLAERYSQQLDLYAKACRKIYNLPIGERIIYSFALSDIIEI